jgi:outer membrane murein-binding lipoprotein Lpp
MKNIFKLLIGIVIIASLLLSACAPPPPPVTKDQLTDAEFQAVEAEKQAETLNVEKEDLEAQVAAKKAELKELQEYKRQLEAE